MAVSWRFASPPDEQDRTHGQELGVGPVAARVFLALWRLNGEEGYPGFVQISAADLAWMANVHESSLRRGLRELEDKGLLLRLAAERPDGGFDPNVYILRDQTT